MFPGTIIGVSYRSVMLSRVFSVITLLLLEPHRNLKLTLFSSVFVPHNRKNAVIIIGRMPNGLLETQPLCTVKEMEFSPTKKKWYSCTAIRNAIKRLKRGFFASRPRHHRRPRHFFFFFCNLPADGVKVKLTPSTLPRLTACRTGMPWSLGAADARRILWRMCPLYRQVERFCSSPVYRLLS